MRDVVNYHRYDFAEYNRVIIIAVVTINHKLYAMKPNMDNEKWKSVEHQKIFTVFPFFWNYILIFENSLQ